MFFEQLEKLCAEAGISPTAATLKLGYSKGTMSNWKKGATPNGDVVVRFAELFNCSTDYLLRGISKTSFLTPSEQTFLTDFRNLNPQGQEYILQTMDMVREKYKKSDSFSILEKDLG